MRSACPRKDGWHRMRLRLGWPSNRIPKRSKASRSCQSAAFQTDVTRVVTFSLGGEGDAFAIPEIGITESRHQLSHHGGDAGYMDADGYIFIHDRVKDMIISGVENIYPAEVENAIYGHPAVAEVAVIGVPDEQWGSIVRAVVVLKPGEKATPEEIIDFCKDKIASYKKPRQVVFVDGLPISPIGKVLRAKIKELWGQPKA